MKKKIWDLYAPIYKQAMKADERIYDYMYKRIPGKILTRNTARAVSVLMVDFFCTLKLSMPLSVLSAMREAGRHKITVKGGMFMERISDANTVIFDETGTLTRACPTVTEVVPFSGKDERMDSSSGGRLEFSQKNVSFAGTESSYAVLVSSTDSFRAK